MGCEVVGDRMDKVWLRQYDRKFGIKFGICWSRNLNDLEVWYKVVFM